MLLDFISLPADNNTDNSGPLGSPEISIGTGPVPGVNRGLFSARGWGGSVQGKPAESRQAKSIRVNCQAGRARSKTNSLSFWRGMKGGAADVVGTTLNGCMRSALICGGQGSARASMRRGYCRQEKNGPLCFVLSVPQLATVSLELPAYRSTCESPTGIARTSRRCDSAEAPTALSIQFLRSAPASTHQVPDWWAHVKSVHEQGLRGEELGSTPPCRVQLRRRHHSPSRASPSPACSSSRDLVSPSQDLFCHVTARFFTVKIRWSKQKSF